MTKYDHYLQIKDTLENGSKFFMLLYEFGLLSGLESGAQKAFNLATEFEKAVALLEEIKPSLYLPEESR
jgi:hypothetical protein